MNSSPQNQSSPPSFQLSEAEASVAAEMFKALGHPLRLRIINELSKGPIHVSELADRLEVAQPVVSQQLRILRSAHLVSSETVAGRAVYRIIEPHLLEMLGCLHKCFTVRREQSQGGL